MTTFSERAVEAAKAIDFAKESRDLKQALADNAYPAADGSADIDNHAIPIIEATLRNVAERFLTAALAVDGLALQGWRTIDSAPKDGTWFLGLAERDMSPYRISWGRNHRDELGWCTSFSSFTGGYITHWSPWPPLTAAFDGEVG